MSAILSLERDTEIRHMCSRQNLRRIDIDLDPDNADRVFLKGATRDDWGELWEIIFDGDELEQSSCIVRFALDGDPKIPLAIMMDAKKLIEWDATAPNWFTRDRSYD